MDWDDWGWPIFAGIIAGILFSLLCMILGAGIWLAVGVIVGDIIAAIVVIYIIFVPMEFEDWWEKVLVIVPTSTFLLMFSLGSIAYDGALFGLQFYVYGWILFVPALIFCIPIAGFFLIINPTFSGDCFNWSLSAANLPSDPLALAFFWIYAITGVVIGCIIATILIWVCIRKILERLRQKHGKDYAQYIYGLTQDFLSSLEWDRIKIILENKEPALEACQDYSPEILDAFQMNFQKIEEMNDNRKRCWKEIDKAKNHLKNGHPGWAVSALTSIEENIKELKINKLQATWDHLKEESLELGRKNWQHIKARLDKIESLIQAHEFYDARETSEETRVKYDELVGGNNSVFFRNTYFIDFDALRSRIDLAEKTYNVRMVVESLAKKLNRVYIKELAEKIGYPVDEVLPILQQLITNRQVPARYDPETKIVDLDYFLEQFDTLRKGFDDLEKGGTAKKI